MVDSQSGAAAIDQVAPFRVERSVATSKLKAFLSDRFWAPGKVRQLAVSPKGLRSVLVPFYCYDGDARSSYRAKVGIYWYRTETYTDSEGKTQTRQVQETEWFSLSGSAAVNIENHLVSASVGLPESESNMLEPFDLGWAQAFDARLVSGFEAELPSIPREQANQTAAAEVRDLEARRIAAEILPGDTNRVESVSTNVDVKQCQLVLLPVWIATYQWKDKAHRLLVNGQTGKAIGSVPNSVPKIVGAIALGLAVIAILFFVLRGGGS